jgi:hypothetical protein
MAYKLLDREGTLYLSDAPGTLGGHKKKKFTESSIAVRQRVPLRTVTTSRTACSLLMRQQRLPQVIALAPCVVRMNTESGKIGKVSGVREMSR